MYVHVVLSLLILLGPKGPAAQPFDNTAQATESSAQAVTSTGLAASDCGDDAPAGGPSYPALYCFDLLPARGIGEAGGRARLLPAGSPFGMDVDREGVHRYRLEIEVWGIGEPGELGPYSRYVAWAVTPSMDRVEKLGVVDPETTSILGEVALNKFLILITAEEDPSVSDWRGRLVLRGQSPSNLLRPHDVLSVSPLAAFAPLPEEDPGAAHRYEPQEQHDGSTKHGGHNRHLNHPGGDSAWQMPPMHPRIAEAPGMAGLEPMVRPYLPAAEHGSAVPVARPRELIRPVDGDTIRLTAGLVSRSIRGQELLMFGFNDQYPGPLIHVSRQATIVVEFTNRLPLPTAVHWHGIRLENRFDGVPHVTQEPVPPGGSFTYRIHFPDAGIYWYHPHHREDIQQDLGLYGNLLVEPSDAGYYNAVDREEVLMLDDLLLGDEGLVPYGRESANFMLMGRFGNVLLVNGEPEYELNVGGGEIVRFFLTNVSNTRTFNLQFDGHRVKIIGSDLGKFERETWASNVVIAPAERYVVEVRFGESGRFAMTNRVQALNHLAGTYFTEVDTLGFVAVEEGASTTKSSGESFDTLRTNDDVAADIDRFREQFNRPVDHELFMTLEVDSLPAVVRQMMRLDPIYFNPVEWSDTMPMMNWITTGREVSWILRDPRTGRENMEIEWALRRGDVVKIRVHNDRNAFHAMQHPLHIHGQRFLVLSRDGVSNDNLVWKDTVLIPTGSVVDLLLDVSNPGRWMVHCHTAEHLESGMMMLLNVSD